MTDDTLVILLADHREYLGEYGLWEHSDVGRKQLLRVPVIMVYPKKLPKGKVIKENIQLIDVIAYHTEIVTDPNNKTKLALQGDSYVFRLLMVSGYRMY